MARCSSSRSRASQKARTVETPPLTLTSLPPPAARACSRTCSGEPSTKWKEVPFSAGLGLIAAPIVFGYVADHYGWQLEFITVGVTYVLNALSWLVIDCTITVVSELTPV